MSIQQHEEAPPVNVDQLIAETESKIDYQLALIDELVSRGQNFRHALIVFAHLVDEVGEVKQQMLANRKAMD